MLLDPWLDEVRVTTDARLCITGSGSTASCVMLGQLGASGRPSREGWTTTASVDYGSGRPAEGDATRSHTAMRGNCTTEDEPGTASYNMLFQSTDSLVLCSSASGLRLSFEQLPREECEHQGKHNNTSRDEGQKLPE